MSDQDISGNVHPSIGTRSKSGDLFSSSSISPSTSSSSHGSAKTAVSECLGAWLNYLQILNSLCSSGHRLAQTISTLEQWSQCEQQSHGFPIPSLPQQSGASQVSTQFVTAWDDLARATAVATSTVKSHIVGVLQDFVSTSLGTFEQEADIQKVREHNQNIVMETAQTMINIQHQFCVASYDSFSSLMCCFVCQTPVGFPHDSECAMLQQPHFARNQNTMGDPRSQTPSPHFGSLAINFPKNDREMYRMPGDTSRQLAFGSGSTQASDHNCPIAEIRGPSPSFLENIRGPLPNPGHLLGMKTPYNRGGRSPLNFPLFPLLNGQRRWSEAAAGEVKGESVFDAESHMRRWSMPWEASKTVKNTVTWHQTKIMPISKLAVPSSKSNSQSTTPDSMWHSSVTSQDGLAEAIQLLSCRPSRIFPPPPPPLGPPFIEEPNTTSNIATYEMWSDRTQERLPSIKFPREKDDDYA